MGLIPVDPGELATIVTTLEMRERPSPYAGPEMGEEPPPGTRPASSLRLIHLPRPASDRYRALFRRVGAPWLWYSRLVMSDMGLREILDDPLVCVLALVDSSGRDVGMLELDHRRPGECELTYVALVPELVGMGHGRWLMGEALARAWTSGVERVWLHTCTLDHPSALGFYRAVGFVPVSRTIETFADPRVIGVLPRDAAPHIPLLASRR